MARRFESCLFRNKLKMNKIKEYKQFIKNNKFLNESLILRNILLETNLNFIVLSEFSDSNKRLKILQTLNNNDISIFVPSIKNVKYYFNNYENLKQIFGGNFYFLYSKFKIFKWEKLVKINLDLKNLKLYITGGFISKKFYSYSKIFYDNLNVEIESPFYLCIKNKRNFFFKLKLLL